MKLQPFAPIQACQHGLTGFTQITSKTNSLERCLRIFYKTIKFHKELWLLQGKREVFPLGKCAIQIKESIEIIGVIQGAHLIQEFVCPNQQGLYLIQTANWQKCVGRVFLFGYNFLSNLKLAEKLELIHLAEMTRIAVGRCSLFLLATDSCYLLYRLSVISEGIRTGRTWQVAASISKIFIVTSTLILRILNAQAPFFLLGLTGISVLTDVVYLAKTEKWV